MPRNDNKRILLDLIKFMQISYQVIAKYWQKQKMRAKKALFHYIVDKNQWFRNES